MKQFDLAQIQSPVLLRGDRRTAYRDPAVCYRNGRFHLFFTLVETEADGTPFLYLATTESCDLIHFSPVRKLTEPGEELFQSRLRSGVQRNVLSMPAKLLP